MISGALVHRTRRRIAVIRREVKRLAGIAAERAAPAESRKCAEIRAHSSFRSLTAAETESILGGELLAALRRA
jgi:4'-phosphopantetheinyl transferase EntD